MRTLPTLAAGILVVGLLFVYLPWPGGFPLAPAGRQYGFGSSRFTVGPSEVPLATLVPVEVRWTSYGAPSYETIVAYACGTDPGCASVNQSQNLTYAQGTTGKLDWSAIAGESYLLSVVFWGGPYANSSIGPTEFTVTESAPVSAGLPGIALLVAGGGLFLGAALRGHGPQARPPTARGEPDDRTNA